MEEIPAAFVRQIRTRLDRYCTRDGRFVKEAMAQEGAETPQEIQPEEARRLGACRRGESPVADAAPVRLGG
jgi:hypothetical protein